MKSTKRRGNRRNNLDLNTLVLHVASMSTNELNMNTKSTDDNKEERAQKLSYDKKFIELKKERDSFESQLKFQVQVNSELKNLLVAAVGEDLQTRVNVLTEDKLQLARALLSSAHNISTHTEQIEYLANQSEVWRSKFLASRLVVNKRKQLREDIINIKYIFLIFSLMVEELARWKASLLQKNKLLLESDKQLLETMSQVRTMQANVLRNLKFLAQLKTLNLPSSNVLDLAHESLNISDQLVLHSGIGMPSNLELNDLDAATEAEKFAIESIQYTNQSLVSSDAAMKAIVDQAFPVANISIGTQTLNENYTS